MAGPLSHPFCFLKASQKNRRLTFDIPFNYKANKGVIQRLIKYFSALACDLFI